MTLRKYYSFSQLRESVKICKYGSTVEKAKHILDLKFFRDNKKLIQVLQQRYF